MSFIAEDFKVTDIIRIGWEDENKKIAVMEIKYEDYIPEGKQYRMEYSEYGARWKAISNPIKEINHFTDTWFFEKNSLGEWKQLVRRKSNFPPKNFVHLEEREIPLKVFECNKLKVLVELGEF